MTSAVPAVSADADSTTRSRRLKPSAPAAPSSGPKGKRRGGRWLKVFAILALILIPVAFGAYSANAAVYFVGTNDDGFVTLYRGLPYTLPAGLDLFTVNYVSGVPVQIEIAPDP